MEYKACTVARCGIYIGLIVISTLAALFTMATMTLSCRSVTKPDDSRVDFGAELTGFDVETMTGKQYPKHLYWVQVLIITR